MHTGMIHKGKYQSPGPLVGTLGCEVSTQRVAVFFANLSLKPHAAVATVWPWQSHECLVRSLTSKGHRPSAPKCPWGQIKLEVSLIVALIVLQTKYLFVLLCTRAKNVCAVYRIPFILCLWLSIYCNTQHVSFFYFFSSKLMTINDFSGYLKIIFLKFTIKAPQRK